MPRSFAEGASVIQTGRINNLDDLRRADYYRELAKMWPNLSEDERNRWRDPAYEKVMEQIREQNMDDFASRVRGEEKLPAFGQPPGQPPAQARPGETAQRPADRPAGNRNAGRNSEQRAPSSIASADAS